MSSSSTTGPPQSSENSGSAEAALRRSNRLLGILPLDEDAIRNGQRSAESDVENLPHDADINAPHDDPLNNLPAALETTTTESDDLNAFNDASSHPSQGNSREGQDTVLNPTDGDGEPPFDENEPHLGDQEQGRITDPSSMRLLQPKTATTRPGGTSASSTSNLPSWDEARGSNTQHRRTVSPSTAAPATINVVVSALREVTTALTDVSQRLVKLESRSEIKAIPKTVPVPTGLHTAIRTSQLTTTNQASIVPPNQATKSFTIAHDSSRVPQSVKPSPTSMASCVDSLNIDPNMDALTRAMITASRLKPTPPSELFCGSSGKKTVEVYLHEITSDFRYILSSNNMKIALLISSMTQNTVAHITSLYTAKYGAITSSGNVDADVFLPRLVEVLREAYTTSTAHMDARLSWESLQLQGHTNFSDFIDTFQKLRTEVGALRGRIIEPSEALGRLWGCLPSSLRQWAGDYLPPPACQDLTEPNDDTANDDAANNDIANNDSLQVDIVSLPQVGYDVNILKNDQREDPHISAIIDSLGNRQKLLNIRVQLKRWTSQCIICLRSRRERQATNTINKFRVKSTKPLEVVNIDYTGPYHGTSGSPVAVVMVCAATNYVCARLVPDRKLSTLVHCLFLLFHEVGFPSILCCDRDSTILAATDQLASWGIVTATIPAHSVKLAWWERVHRQLHDHMRSYLLSQQEALQRNGNLSPPPPSFADTEKALASSVLAANETPRGPGGFGITPNMMIRSN
ncbi:hypothetical protein FOL46_000579, partial [Perkinsus olseni]